MKPDPTPWVVLGGLMALLVLAVVAFGELLSLDETLSAALQLDRSRERINMQTYSEVVTTASGRQITVTTTRQDGETVKAFADRHDAAVAEAKSR